MEFVSLVLPNSNHSLDIYEESQTWYGRLLKKNFEDGFCRGASRHRFSRTFPTEFQSSCEKSSKLMTSISTHFAGCWTGPDVMQWFTAMCRAAVKEEDAGWGRRKQFNALRFDVTNSKTTCSHLRSKGKREMFSLIAPVWFVLRLRLKSRKVHCFYLICKTWRCSSTIIHITIQQKFERYGNLQFLIHESILNNFCLHILFIQGIMTVVTNMILVLLMRKLYCNFISCDCNILSVSPRPKGGLLAAYPIIINQDRA